MENKQKVSVIIPIYNVEKFLGKCLTSVCRQTYKNIEVILVDDGSQDNSLNIARDFSQYDSRIKVVRQSNAGVSAARNTGIEKSTGEYLCFIDADDIVSDDYVEYLLSLVVKYEAEVAVTTGVCYTIESFSKEISANRGSFREELLSSEEATRRMLCYHYPIGCYAKMFKRSFLGNSCRFILGQRVGEGFNFNVYTLSRANKVVEGNKVIYMYRQDNTESCMTKFNPEKVKAALKAIELLCKSSAIQTENVKKGIIFADWHTSGDMYNWMVLSGVKGEYPELYKTCFRKVRHLSFKVLFINTTRKEKIRAMIRFLHPKLPIILARLRHKTREL